MYAVQFSLLFAIISSISSLVPFLPDLEAEQKLIEKIELNEDDGCLYLFFASGNLLTNPRGYEGYAVTDHIICDDPRIIDTSGLQNGEDWRGRRLCISLQNWINEWNRISQLSIEVEYTTLGGVTSVETQNFCPRHDGICDCSACPDINAYCHKHCDNGFTKDRNGCRTCECEETPELIEKLELEEEAGCLYLYLASGHLLTNPYGYEEYTIRDHIDCDNPRRIDRLELWNSHDHRGQRLCIFLEHWINEWNRNSELSIEIAYTTLNGNRIIEIQNFCPPGGVCLCSESHLGSRGGSCPEGTVITSLEECRAAIASLEITSTGEWTQPETNYVYGCSIKHTQNNMLHFNTNTAGVERGTETPVCKGKFSTMGITFADEWNFRDEDSTDYSIKIFSDEEQALLGSAYFEVECDINFRLQRDDSSSSSSFTYLDLDTNSVRTQTMRGGYQNQRFEMPSCTEIVCHKSSHSSCPWTSKNAILLAVDFRPRSGSAHGSQWRRNRFTFTGTHYYVHKAEVCSSGTIRAKHDICCAASCGSCGGRDCGNRPGGGSKCCHGGIRNSGRYCTSPEDVACIVPRFGNGRRSLRPDLQENFDEEKVEQLNKKI